MPRSDLALRLLALAMAIALLVLVHGERRVTYALILPVEARLPPGVEPASPLPGSVRASLSGAWARLRQLDPAEVGPVLLDLSRAGPGLATWVARPETLRVPAGVRVESLHPAQGAVELLRDRP